MSLRVLFDSNDVLELWGPYTEQEPYRYRLSRHSTNGRLLNIAISIVGRQSVYIILPEYTIDSEYLVKLRKCLPQWMHSRLCLLIQDTEQRTILVSSHVSVCQAGKRQGWKTILFPRFGNPVQHLQGDDLSENYLQARLYKLFRNTRP